MVLSEFRRKEDPELSNSREPEAAQSQSLKTSSWIGNDYEVLQIGDQLL